MTTTGVPSPCVDVCRMDEATGWCAGCLRTLDEIAAWSTLADADKRRVWAVLAERRVAWQRAGRPSDRLSDPQGGPGAGQVA